MAASCVALKPRARVEPSQAGAEPWVAEPLGHGAQLAAEQTPTTIQRQYIISMW